MDDADAAPDTLSQLFLMPRAGVWDHDLDVTKPVALPLNENDGFNAVAHSESLQASEVSDRIFHIAGGGPAWYRFVSDDNTIH